MPKVCCNSTKFKLCIVVNENKYSKMMAHLACSHTQAHTHIHKQNQTNANLEIIISSLYWQA